MSQIVDFSQIKTINHNGIDISKLVINGTRLWERYEIDEVYQEWVESGYTQEDAIVPSSVWLSDSDNRWVELNGSFSFVKFGGIMYAPPYTLNGESFVSKGGVVLQKGILYSDGTFYYYKIRKVTIADKWIDTSVNVEKTRKKTMYYY